MSDLTNDNSKKQSRKDCFLFFKNNIYLLLGMSIAVAICMYGILGIFGFSAFPDEFGYWSPAAALLGYDWSEITGIGSYYSYGYSALLFPILLIFQNAVEAYRAAIILNLLLQCASMALLFLVIRELFPEDDRNTSAIIAVVSVLYPAWLFYVQSTMAEALLYFGLILSVYLMLRFLRKTGVITGLLLVIILVYLYMVHMRCIGTIAAGILTIFLWVMSQRRNREKKNGRAWIVPALIIALFAGTFILKDKIIQLLYHGTSESVLSWNDYSGIMYRVNKIISLKGLTNLLKDFCGKVLYIGLSTFGIAYFGMAGCAKRAVAALKALRKKQASCRDFLWTYVFLMVVFQFMVALVYLNGASAPDADRLDNFLHGRYIDIFLPILFMVGLEEMLHVKNVYFGMVLSLLIYMALSLVAYRVIIGNGVQMRNAHSFTMIGMSYFLEKPLTNTVQYFNREVFLRVMLTLMTDIIVIASRMTRQRLLVTLLLVIQVVLGVKACTQFVFLNQEYIYGDIMMADKLKEIKAEYPDKSVLHIYEGGVPYIELVQFGCRDIKISVVNGENKDIDVNEYLKDGTILITCEEQDYEEILDDYYSEKWELGHLRMYYTP